MNNLTISALHMAGDLLSDPSRRCVGTLATDANGFPVNVTDETACKFCLTGAVSLASFKLGITEPKDQMDIYQAMKETLGIGLEISAPVFWDSNEDLHDLVAKKLQKA